MVGRQWQQQQCHYARFLAFLGKEPFSQLTSILPLNTGRYPDNHASPATGPSAGLFVSLQTIHILNCAPASAVPAPGPTALRVYPRIALRYPRRIPQAHPTRSWSGFREGKDGRERSEGSACARKSASGVSGRPDAHVYHDAGEGEE
jgi:hypothetical protein